MCIRDTAWPVYDCSFAFFCAQFLSFCSLNGVIFRYISSALLHQFFWGSDKGGINGPLIICKTTAWQVDKPVLCANHCIVEHIYVVLTEVTDSFVILVFIHPGAILFFVLSLLQMDS